MSLELTKELFSKGGHMLITHRAPSPFPDGMPIPDLLSPQRPRKGEKTDHADYLNLPGLISDPLIVEGKCVIRVKAEQIRVPISPGCACLIKEVKPHSSFTMDDVYDTPDARKSNALRNLFQGTEGHKPYFLRQQSETRKRRTSLAPVHHFRLTF